MGIICSNGAMKESEVIADCAFTQLNKDGKEVINGVMINVWVGAGKFNLFSLSKRLSQGWSVKGDSENLVLHKDEISIVFDQMIKFGSGYLYGTTLRPRHEIAAALVAKKATGPVKLSVQKAHNLFGHMGGGDCRATAKASGYELKLLSNISTRCWRNSSSLPFTFFR